MFLHDGLKLVLKSFDVGRKFFRRNELLDGRQNLVVVVAPASTWSWTTRGIFWAYTATPQVVASNVMVAHGGSFVRNLEWPISVPLSESDVHEPYAWAA